MDSKSSKCKIFNDILAVNICQKEKENEYFECMQDMKERDRSMREAFCMSRAYNCYISCINVNTPKNEKSTK